MWCFIIIHSFLLEFYAQRHQKNYQAPGVARSWEKSCCSWFESHQAAGHDGGGRGSGQGGVADQQESSHEKWKRWRGGLASHIQIMLQSVPFRKWIASVLKTKKHQERGIESRIKDNSKDIFRQIRVQHELWWWRQATILEAAAEEKK